MERLDYDIIIVGSGIAGLAAAIHAAGGSGKGPKIAVVTKLHAMRSHSASAEGGMAGVASQRDTHSSQELHAIDTIKGSDYLADQDAVEVLVNNAPKEINFLEHLGVPWNRDAAGNIATRAFGGMSMRRTAFAEDKSGLFIMRALYDETTSMPNIHIFHEHYATKLIRRGANFLAICATDLSDGSHKLFAGKACIIATGGFSRLFSFSTASRSSTGDGIALAYDAGLRLKDMEFVQFHPTALVPGGTLITEAARGEGGYLINAKGERFMEKYAPKMKELAPRDVVSRAIISEIAAGRGIANGRRGMAHVCLDLRHLDPKIIDERLPMVRELCNKLAGIDVEKEPIPVRPAAHFTMGGIDTNSMGLVMLASNTPMENLLAAGECGCVSVHGANRLGSNSLAQCAVWGRITGTRAAKITGTRAALSIQDMKFMGSQADMEERRLSDIFASKGDVSPYVVRLQLQEMMARDLGVFRSGARLAGAITKLGALHRRFARIYIEDRGRIYNTNLEDALSTANMLSLAEAVICSALGRKESRGAHYLLERPQRDDGRYMRHTIAARHGSRAAISYEPVRITRWKLPREVNRQ